MPQRGQEAHFKEASKAAHLKDSRKAWQMTRTGPHHLLFFLLFQPYQHFPCFLSPLGCRSSKTFGMHPRDFRVAVAAGTQGWDGMPQHSACPSHLSACSTVAPRGNSLGPLQPGLRVLWHVRALGGRAQVASAALQTRAERQLRLRQ